MRFKRRLTPLSRGLFNQLPQRGVCLSPRERGARTCRGCGPRQQAGDFLAQQDLPLPLLLMLWNFLFWFHLTMKGSRQQQEASSGQAPRELLAARCCASSPKRILLSCLETLQKHRGCFGGVWLDGALYLTQRRMVLLEVEGNPYAKPSTDKRSVSQLCCGLCSCLSEHP